MRTHQSRFTALQDLFRGRSLTSKLLLTTISTGMVVALLLGYLQSRELHETFQNQLNTELAIQAENDRAQFDNYVQEVRFASKIIVSHNNFSDYVSHHLRKEKRPVLHYDLPPPWLPERSLLRAFLHTRYALLLDNNNQVREVYYHHLSSDRAQLPARLLHPSPLLRKLSHNQSYMTEMDGMPYILAAQTLVQDNHTLATLLLASPIDSRFLSATTKEHGGSTIMALLDLKSGLIVASSDPAHIPENSDITYLNKHYLMIGKSFFDYGASDLQTQFTSFLSTDRADQMAATLLDKNRDQRLLLVATLVLISTLLMMWVSRRVRKLSDKVNHTAAELFGSTSHSESGGDELQRLERDFIHFRDEISAARKRIEVQTEETLALSQQVAEGKQRARELWSLQSVTETLEVGIILDSHEGLISFNPLMERFAEECHGIEPFLLDEAYDKDERQLTDIYENPRYFEIKRHHALGPRGLLVRDITVQRQAEEERQVFASFPAQNPNPILRVSEQGEILYANIASQPLLDRYGLNIGDPVPAEWAGALKESMNSGQKEFEVAVDKQVFGFVPAFIDGSSFFYLYGHDISERKHAEEELLLSAAVTNNVLDAIMITDHRGTIININPAFERITGYLREEIIDHEPSIIHSRRHDETFFQQLWQSLYENGQWEGEMWNRRKDGEVFPCIARVSAIRNQQGQILNFVYVFTDISERKEYEEKLTHMAYFDALTRLPNRILFLDRLNQSLHLASRNREKLAVLFIDLDGFKQVNDQLGHNIGDQLLQEVAGRLLKSVRDSDTVSRLAGDEFAIILHEISDQATVEQLAHKILTTLSQPFMLEGNEANISGSIGIALYPGDSNQAEGLLKRADEAMYQAKHMGKNSFFFADSMPAELE